jgi:hypothetical protein
MRRTWWLATGAALGAGGTLWVEHQVRQRLQAARERLSPQGLAAGARESVQGAADRLRAAVEAGRQERVRREDELWAGLRPEDAQVVRPGRQGARR